VPALGHGAFEDPAAPGGSRLVDDREHTHGAGQNRVNSLAGGSIPPVAGTPASSRSPRRT
jgi:hypothetical protein